MPGTPDSAPQQQRQQRPLEGLTVLGVEQFIAGPYCTMILADAGAEVIKIERPGVGDPRRTIGPYLTAADGRTRVSGGFLEYNRNKKSVTLNLQTPEGKEILRRLAATADVLVENFRPGTMGRLGLGYEQLSLLNPRLVYAAISGFGQLEGYVGPYSAWPAFDIVAEAMSGVMHIVGYADRPPTTTIYGLADTYSGLVAALGIMFALRDRERAGVGQFVDTSMYDSMLALNERSLTTYSLTGEVPVRGHETIQGPRAAFKAADGYVALNIPTDDLWRRFAALLGRPDLADDPRAKDGPSRARNAEGFLRPVIEGWMAGKTKAEVVRLMLEAGIPAGPVQTAADIFACSHVAKRRMLLEVNDPQLGPRLFCRTPLRLSRAAEVEGRPAPRLGEHTVEVLGRLGYGVAEVAAMRAAGVV
jgi:formyl-CoA transferase